MAGSESSQGGMFSYVSPELQVPQDHPPRAIRRSGGRPSIPPERLLRALLL